MKRRSFLQAIAALFGSAFAPSVPALRPVAGGKVVNACIAGGALFQGDIITFDDGRIRQAKKHENSKRVGVYVGRGTKAGEIVPLSHVVAEGVCPVWMMDA